MSDALRYVVHACSGEIDRINPDGTYAVLFDDGDYLKDATVEEIRLPKHTMVSQADSLLAFIEVQNIAPDEQPLAAEPESGSAAPAGVGDILQNVEQFLLPANFSIVPQLSATSNPRQKLETLLVDAAVRDHTRTMQTMYRDDEDELFLGKELRGASGSNSERMPTKALLEQISADRMRALALCRLCYGDSSLEMVRAELDIAAGWALRGLWPNVSDKIAKVDSMIVDLTSQHRFMDRLEREARQATRIAKRVGTVFDCLRDHVKDFCGQITPPFLDTLRQALLTSENVGEERSPSHYSSFSAQVTDLVASIHDFISTIKNRGIALAGYNNRSVAEVNEARRRRGEPPVEMSQEPPRLSASWGELVEFLRNDCPVMKTWIVDMQNGLLPQNKAVLQFVFGAADSQARGVCHPVQLAARLSQYPSVVKILSGTGVVRSLSQLKMEVPMFVDPGTGKVCDIAAIQSNLYKLQDTQRVVYEVPICWEELLALYIIDVPHNSVDMLRVQQLVLLGMSEIFQKQLQEAEEHMIEALHILEAHDLEMEAVASELYNSIAQMMIMKHREWHAQKNSRCKANAEAWVDTAEGERELREEVEVVMHHYRQKHIAISRAEAEARSRTVLVKARTALLLEMEVDTSLHSVEAAFRYLVRGIDIMEKAHQSGVHPSIATSMLAVASVQNLCGNMQDAREWLVKCLRILEKLSPVPDRAIAFVHVQLSNVLLKLEHEEEAMRILSEAAAFYLEKSREGVLKHVSRQSVASERQPFELAPLYEPVTKYGATAGCYSDVMFTLEYTRKLLRLNRDLSDSSRHMAVDKSIVMAELLESAFGWDSKEVSKQRKDIGEQCLAICDYTRAHENFTKHLEACEVLYGDNDKRTADALHLVQVR
jgi:tetratricopeptide (TPR) repeat protein